MLAKKQRAIKTILMLICGLCFLSEAFGAPVELRNGSQMVATILAPKEERKQALSMGDTIFIGIDRPLEVKKGDVLEIFQPTSIPGGDKTVQWFARAGEVVVLEIINDRLLLGIIESSAKEVAVGDRLYLPEK